jgi:hypothetical protein
MSDRRHAVVGHIAALAEQEQLATAVAILEQMVAGVARHMVLAMTSLSMVGVPFSTN